MARFGVALAAWGTDRFTDALRDEIEKLGPEQLPLQQGLRATSQVSNKPIQATVLDIVEEPGLVRARAGIFYSGIIAGCSCADDPTPVPETPEYCEVLLKIDKRTGDTLIALV
ncbi:MAG: hypothetical protein P8X48_04805 [Acidiferrobacteraceae bacterium]|jgi:hypothetical protein